MIPPQGDDFDSIRAEYTEMLQNQLARGNNGLVKTKYLTFGVDAESIQSAKPRLERIETDLLNHKCVELTGFEIAVMISRTNFSKSRPVAPEIPVESLFQYFDVCDDSSDTVYAACRTNGKVLILLSYYIQYYPSRKSTETDYIMQARDYIERNFRQVSCTVKSVADKVQIDRTYLYRLFKEETGFSVIEYINNCRIGRACTMLNNTNVQIKDVALSVGFSDQLYFSKVFRKLKGITPTEYRKKYANETTL